jgi:hypothetical protein
VNEVFGIADDCVMRDKAVETSGRGCWCDDNLFPVALDAQGFPALGNFVEQAIQVPSQLCGRDPFHTYIMDN